MEYVTSNGDVVNVVSLMEDDDANLKVTTVDDLAQLVVAMGWDNLEQFEQETRTNRAQLVDRWFTVVKDRVYLA